MQSVLLFVVAAILNIWAATSYGFPVRRALAAAIATSAVFYIGAYVWLTIEVHSPAEQLRWALFLRGIARITVPVAWWGPAVLSIQFGRTFKKVSSSKVGDHE